MNFVTQPWKKRILSKDSNKRSPENSSKDCKKKCKYWQKIAMKMHMSPKDCGKVQIPINDRGKKLEFCPKIVGKKTEFQQNCKFCKSAGEVMQILLKDTQIIKALPKKEKKIVKKSQKA